MKGKVYDKFHIDIEKSIDKKYNSTADKKCMNQTIDV